ncbi:lipopolysaccharide biosynthesis protein [Aureimonas leprariae]|uniref:Lipopolysaccharide biosynthesis protein n=1 Tax=Plantimonas leprariae TaxID=2615207 RepID=A0A7V7TZ45_9HYPH|nr:lipopolysaccharide biosynthesis protein [Aureimonas leprariae]KAB0678785.1 lipopolysaccharide biosynthesis protein [Aureimonas leprariae]
MILKEKAPEAERTEPVMQVQQGAERYAHLTTKRSAAALRGIFWSMINSIVPSSLAAGIFLFSSRMLHPADFGLVALALSVSSIIGSVAPSGFGEALIQRKSLDETHLSTVFWVCVSAGFIAFATTFLVAFPVAYYTGQPIMKALLPVTGLKVVFDMAALVPGALLARKMSFHLVAMRTTIASLVSGSVCVVLLLLGYGLWALALSQVAASVASVAGAFAAAGWFPKGRPTLAAFNDLKRFGLYASATNFMQFIYPEQLLVGSLLGPTALGIYGFGRRIFQILNDLIAGALSSVSHALLSSLQAEREKLQRVFLVATFMSAAVAFPVFSGLAAVAEDGVPIVFGPQWVPAIPSVQLFCILGLISSVGFIQIGMIKARGAADWWFWYQTVKKAVLTVSVFVSFSFGVTAVVAAAVIGALLLFPAPIWKSAQLIEIRLSTYVWQFVPPTIASTMMAATVWLFRDLGPEMDRTIRLIASICIGGCIYCVTLAVMSHGRLREILTLVRRGR